MNIFEEVKDRLDVRQVIEGYGTKVDRKGHFICPFHNDTHPSASIKKDFFNCFVCGSGGDVITYTGKMFGLKNYDAAKKLIDDFDLNIKTEPLCVSEQLRAKRAYQKRLQQRKEEQEMENLVKHTGDVLADMHRYLWQGKRDYPVTHIRHLRALSNLAQMEYYLEEYDREPKGFSIQYRKLVKLFERALFEWNHQNE